MVEITPKGFNKYKFEEEILKVIKKWYEIPEDIIVERLDLYISVESTPRITMKFLKSNK